MRVSLYGELLMEIRRLHVAGTSFGISKKGNIKCVAEELISDSPSLPKIINIIESDPGLSVSVIKLANCTIINGAAAKKITVKQAIIRIGFVGIDSAIKLHQAKMLKQSVASKSWRDSMDKSLDKALIAGALSYKIAMMFTGKRADAELSLNLSILYSLGIFAKIIAADSLGYDNNAQNRKFVLENSAVAAEAVLITASASYELIRFIEKIESECDQDICVTSARAGWGFLNGTMGKVAFNGVEIDKKRLM